MSHSKIHPSLCILPTFNPLCWSNRHKQNSLSERMEGGNVAQLVEHQNSTLPTQIRFPDAESPPLPPPVHFQCRLSYGVRTRPCAIACIYICAYVKDPVVHVRVRWTMETRKHPAWTLGWVKRLCRSCLSPGKATRIFHGRNPIGTMQL